jgi:hypothetical protein
MRKLPAGTELLATSRLAGSTNGDPGRALELSVFHTLGGAVADLLIDVAPVFERTL